MTSPHPEFFTFTQARDNARELAQARRREEDNYKFCVEKAADAEANYRKKFAAAFLSEEGTMAEREQRARLATADAARDRDLKDGLARASLERLRGLEGERAMLRLLVQWSERHDGPQPAWSREAA
jgi:predicted HTH transcriptional regulator